MNQLLSNALFQESVFAVAGIMFGTALGVQFAGIRFENRNRMNKFLTVIGIFWTILCAPAAVLVYLHDGTELTTDRILDILPFVLAPLAYAVAAYIHGPLRRNRIFTIKEVLLAVLNSKAVFALIDADGDGLISPNDLRLRRKAVIGKLLNAQQFDFLFFNLSEFGHAIDDHHHVYIIAPNDLTNLRERFSSEQLAWMA